MPPLVSIIIPFRNAADTLADTLESVRMQTWKEWELILVDDGSTDESMAIAEASGCRANATDPHSRVRCL
jgi:glycosyltransferase involved in cell wall biosynthesis